MSLGEFKKYHGVDLLDFQKYIESIGFKQINAYYYYNDHRIKLHYNWYVFYNGSKWFEYYDLNDLSPLENEFKHELRRIKLKQLLNNNRIIKI